ncbi:hypothetical protein EV360DRAFT_76628 [Lentinula raphanica]|nr:hypothetical protein EV360DRAFT_76628 [Lentinula raphanica]
MPGGHFASWGMTIFAVLIIIEPICTGITSGSCELCAIFINGERETFGFIVYVECFVVTDVGWNLADSSQLMKGTKLNQSLVDVNYVGVGVNGEKQNFIVNAGPGVDMQFKMVDSGTICGHDIVNVNKYRHSHPQHVECDQFYIKKDHSAEVQHSVITDQC